MPFLIAIFIFLLGTAIGSFLNVVVLRLGVSPIRGRSRCPHCGKVLEWFELIPLLSFFAQKGRCRRCRARLSLQYPLVEALAGAMFLLVFWRLIWDFPTDVSSALFLNGAALWIWPFVIFWWYYGSVLLAISAYDIRHYVIPDALLLPAVFVAAGAAGYQEALRLARPPFFPESGFVFSGSSAILLGTLPSGAIGSALAGIAVAAGILGALHYFSRGRAMGFGDVKLGIFMGLALGWPDTLVAIFLAFAAGTLWSIAAILAKKKTMKSRVPFGPFLAFGIMCAMLAADAIMRFYFHALPQIFFAG